MSKILLREKYQARYLRWESRRIEQMGFVNNLLIGLTSVVLFWLLEGALEGKLPLYQYVFWAAAISGGCFFFSLICGLWLALNRLKDFRLTGELVQFENKRAYFEEKAEDVNAEKKANELKNDISSKKEFLRKLGERSWWFFNVQGTLFAVGFLFIVIAVILKISGFK